MTPSCNSSMCLEQSRLHALCGPPCAQAGTTHEVLKWKPSVRCHVPRRMLVQSVCMRQSSAGLLVCSSQGPSRPTRFRSQARRHCETLAPLLAENMARRIQRWARKLEARRHKAYLAELAAQEEREAKFKAAVLAADVSQCLRFTCSSLNRVRRCQCAITGSLIYIGVLPISRSRALEHPCTPQGCLSAASHADTAMCLAQECRLSRLAYLAVYIPTADCSSCLV